jgi:ABC-2 type transport system permease protein
MDIKNNTPFFRVLKRELKILARKWPNLFVTFVGPLTAFLLISWIFSSNVPNKLPVAVVDMDHTALSRQMTRMVDATSIASVNRSFVSLFEAKLAMEKGLADAVLYIPKGIEKDIYRGEGTKVALYLNNANVLKGGLLNSGIRKSLSTLSAGIKLQLKLKRGMNQQQAIARIMPIQLRSVILFNPYISYSYYLSAGLMPVMLIVFTLLGSIYTLGTELLRGTGPKWLEASNNNIIIALAGKLLPYTLIYTCLAMVMNTILFHFLGMPVHGNLPLIVLGEVFLIVAYQFLAIFFVGLTSNLRLSVSLGSAYSMLALTYSGLTFPIFGMPAFAQAFAHIFPYTYFIKLLISQSLRAEPLANSILPLFSLFLFVLLGILFIPRLKSLLTNKKRWGKI